MKFNAQEIRTRIGNWDAVLAGLAPELDAALSRKGWHVPCPVHGGRDGFRLFRDTSGGGICNTCGAFPDGFALLQWLRGWSFPQVLEQTIRWLGMGCEATVARRAVEPRRSADLLENRRRRNRLQAVWDESLPLGDHRARPARLYLARRGLHLVRMPAVLRYHPELAYFDDREERVIGSFPVLLALVTGAGGQPVTIHRTYLSAEGRKAPVDKPKKLMTYPMDRALVGGSIRLSAPGPELGLAEGIETALAIVQATGIPVWSCVSAALLEQVEIPRGVRQVTIWADRDCSGVGQRAAERLGARLRGTGRRVQVLLPDPPIPAGAKGLDWLDMLNHQGEEAIREVICGTRL